MVKVLFFATIRNMTREKETSAPGRQTVRDLLVGLSGRYGEAFGREALEAGDVSDRIIVMKNAVIAQEGTPRELYDAPSSAFVADFIGEANLLDCEIASVKDGKAMVHLGPAKLSIPSRGMPAGPARLAVRPTRIAIGKPGASNGIPAKLDRVIYVGKHLECFAETGIGRIFAICPDVDAPLKAGDEVSLVIPERGAVLVSS